MSFICDYDAEFKMESFAQFEGKYYDRLQISCPSARIEIRYYRILNLIILSSPINYP